MTETTTPAWLTAAENDRDKAKGADVQFRQQQAEKHATAINATLAKLDIDPLVPARAEAGQLVPALLLSRDSEHEHYGVYVGWSDTNEQAALLVADWEPPGHRFHGLRYARLLNRVSDVLDAREQGPAPQPAPRRDLRAEALRSVAALRVDHTGADAASVAEAINGLTVAVLHLAEVTAAV